MALKTKGLLWIVPLILGACVEAQEILRSDECLQYGLQYCSSCYNAGVRCYECPHGYRLRDDKTHCEACPQFCTSCALRDQTAWCITCVEGYQLNHVNSVDVCEISQCEGDCLGCYLVDDQNQCTSCRNPGASGRSTTLSDDASSCLDCPENCVVCTASDTDVAECTECTDGYVISFTRQCLKCRTSCATCASTEDGSTGFAQCASCPDRNYLTDDNQCASCLDLCAKCFDAATCDVCTDGHYWSGTDCTPCQSSLCKTCDSDGVCDVCKDGFGVKPVLPFSCDKCPSNCEQCTSNTDCSECSTKYGFNSDGNCVNCPANCVSCSLVGSTLECDECALGYKIDPDNTCHACPAGCTDGNCEYSAIVQGAVCTQCDVTQSQAVDDSTGQCLDCPTLCVECSYNATLVEFECTSCQPYNGLDQSGTCVSCGAGCPDCTYDNSISGMACVCIDRPAAGTHTPAVLSTAISNLGQCDSGGDTAYACDTGYYYDAAALICQECTVTGCDVCDGSSTVCAICSSDYAGPKSDDSCDACSSIANCVECTLKRNAVRKCDVCADRFYVNRQGACPACTDSLCQSCIYAGQRERCLTCGPGYVVKSKNQCLECPSDCDYCQIKRGSPACLDNGCKADTTFYNDACYKCPLNCELCSFDEAIDETTVCLRCYDGWAVNDVGSCTACPDHCSACTYGSAISCYSDSCDAGYGVDTDGTCKECQSNCEVCGYFDPLNAFECSECAATYYLNDDECAACPSKCLTCEVSEVSPGTMECTECSGGFYIDDKKGCAACGGQCLVCDGPNVCIQCSTGYGINAAASCSVCSVLTSSAECTECSWTICEACIDGYVVSDDGLGCLPIVIDPQQPQDQVCARYEDRSWECAECLEDRLVMPDGRCGYNCYVCPNGPLDSAQSCDVNPREASYETEECYTGYCWAHADINRAANTTYITRGCNSTALFCPFDMQLEGFCVDANNRTACDRCCLEDKCNDYVLVLSASPPYLQPILPLVILIAVMLYPLLGKRFVDIVD